MQVKIFEGFDLFSKSFDAKENKDVSVTVQVNIGNRQGKKGGFGTFGVNILNGSIT
jgi:hypothetical protein